MPDVEAVSVNALLLEDCLQADGNWQEQHPHAFMYNIIAALMN